MMPERLTETPPRTTSQKMIFWPALNFLAGGWTPRLNMPPPLASQITS